MKKYYRIYIIEREDFYKSELHTFSGANDFDTFEEAETHLLTKCNPTYIYTILPFYSE